MAVDVTPAPNEDLKTIRFIKENIEKLESLKRVMIEDLKMLQVLKDSLNKMVFSNLERKIEQVKGEIRDIDSQMVLWDFFRARLERLCSYCKGKQMVDHSMSGQMTQVCFLCGGSGLEEDNKDKDIVRSNKY